MNFLKEDIYKNLSTSLKRIFIAEPYAQRLLIAIIVCALIAVLFFPTSSLLDPSYKVDDIAVTDIKSPADITVGEIYIKRDEIVVREGDRITEEGLIKIDAINAESKPNNLYLSIPGLFFFTFILFYTLFSFSKNNLRNFSSKPRDLLFMALILIGALLLLKLLTFVALSMEAGFPAIPSSFYIYLTPVAAGAMMVRLFINSETAIVFAIVSSILSGLFLGGNLYISSYFLIGGVVAAMEVRHCIQRSTILKAGIILGIVNSLIIVAIATLNNEIFTLEALFTTIAGFACGIITAVIVTGLTPVFEIAFGYTTNIKLLELSRMDHPLLKELAMQAPGTYHHSLIIGSLVEAAAESINANPLLSRVSAYYHDIGKAKMPLYFAENMKGENKHDKLTPNMSALILINHVKEGEEMANKYRLGDEIKNVIQQHHGTSLIRYFYEKAKDDPEIHTIREEVFRYPGPKPQTKEAGLVMLADSIEAASKTLPDPTDAMIQGMVQKIINRIFIDGQLDECELTLRDLNAIAKSFNRVLDGIFHQRIEYPEPAYITKEEAVENNDSKPSADKGGDKKDKGGSKNGIRRLGVS